jgi:hypothetical protein
MARLIRPLHNTKARAMGSGRTAPPWDQASAAAAGAIGTAVSAEMAAEDSGIQVLRVC